MMRIRYSDCNITKGLSVLALILSLVFAGHGSLIAQELPKPSSEVLLTVDGNIGVTNANGKAEFDRSMLEALGMQSLKTSNPFEMGLHEFEGVLLRDLLDTLKAAGTTLEARALDGYTIEMPIKDAYDYPVMLAMLWNGEIMRVRNRGPIWVIYPIDLYDELKGPRFSGRSIWQLKSITVK